MTAPGSPQARIRRPIHVMAKPTGATCNLNCSYCYYLHKDAAPPAVWRMSDEVLENFIRQFLATHPGPEVTFAWQGGEPTLLGLPTFRRILALQARYRGAGQTVANTLQTNGILLDEEWAEFLRQNNFLIGVSIDGPEELHDHHRLDKGDEPTFRRVMASIGLLRRRGVEYNLLCTINDANGDHGARVYRFLREQAVHIQFIPVVERVGDPDPSSRGQDLTRSSVRPAQFGKFLCDAFDVWFSEDVGRVHVQLFEVQVAAALGLPAGLCTFNETCGDAVVLERDGSVYSCDHYVYPPYRLGNIAEQHLSELCSTSAQRRFGNAKRDTLTKRCRACAHLHRCHGDCPKHRFATAPDGEGGQSYLCPGYLRFFEHCSARFDAMADGLRRGISAPISASAFGESVRARKVGPNDPCSCGSAKKRKKCCG